MASLPPKPVSSPPPPPGKDDDDRRRSRRLSQDDRAYGPPRSRPMADIYIAAYDRSRDDDRYGDRHRDREWDRRNWDSRDRGPRGREDDRDRFSHRYDRGRSDTYFAPDDRRARRPPSPRRPDRYRSRSPRSRRPYSPPRHMPRPRSPPPSRRPRYNESRSPRRGRSRSRSRTPERRRRNYSRESLNNRPNNSRPSNTSTSPSKRRTSRSTSRSRPTHNAPDDGPPVAQHAKVAEEKPEASAIQNGPDLPAPDNVHRPKDNSLGDNLDQKPLVSSPVVVQRSPRQTESSKNEIRSSPKREPQAQDMNVKRSPSPPRQPRHMGNQHARDVQYARRTSRSPPRGPRNPAKIFSGPGATPPSHTSGVHGGRRPPPPGMSSYPRTAHGPHDVSNLNELHAKRSNRLERAPITASLDAEIARLENHRANLAAEYVDLAKNTRRALHELDMATIDLRAAEARRKVADGHLEKARAGMFGIDAAPPLAA